MICSYWFCFEPTGDEIVDEILHRVARAGKAFHSTEHWSENEWGPKDGISHVTWIQEAAVDAASYIAFLEEEMKKMHDRLEELA